MEECCQTYLQPIDRVISQADILQVRDALQVLDTLPDPISAMFKHLAGVDAVPQQVQESYQIWYHIPSRLFNITQLHRLATPERLATTITEAQTRCNNFVEVRGDPKIEGCYASLEFLEAFVKQFGLELPQAPDVNSTRPTFDPSDFSEIPQSRIILARPGMVGYGSMLRTGDQANFLFSRTPTNFETLSTFIPTKFGNMKVIPKLPRNVRTHARPEHWSKYRTADEYEAQANLSSRVTRQPVSRKARTGAASVSIPTAASILPDVMEVDEFALGRMLRERDLIRAEARPSAKRDTDAIASKPEQSSPKRFKSDKASPGSSSSKTQDLPNITQSFVERAKSGLQERPTSRPRSAHQSVPVHGASFISRGFLLMGSNGMLDPGVSMTDVADDESLEEDWALVNKMLDFVNEDDDPEVQGITGFEIHDFNASMMDIGQPPARTASYVGKGKGKATATPPPPTLAQSSATMAQHLDSSQHPESALSGSLRYSPPGTPGPSKNMNDSPATSFLKQHRRRISNHSNGEDMGEQVPTPPFDPAQSFGHFGRGLGSPTQDNTPLPDVFVPMAAFSRDDAQQMDGHVISPPASSTQLFDVEEWYGSPIQVNMFGPSKSAPAGAGGDYGNPLFGTPRRTRQSVKDIGSNLRAGGDEDMPDTDGEDE
ncbi:hypothetical protein DE146DRAFT_759207 [Phaeosphaeria sp. MPI-PUGE-AT-0046c]|nr:hypothetical protein DE146DRAFT_759207 [Phaeosphaeria sp. MPI-PUGE-AT-0046c]